MIRNYKIGRLSILIIFGGILGTVGCNKLVQVSPPVTSVTQASVYNTDANAISVLTGLYTKMSASSYPNAFDITTSSYWAGLSADEFILWSGVSSSSNFIAYYTNTLYSNPLPGAGVELWGQLFSYIFTCNSALDGVANSTSLTPSIQQQLLGEAYFMRGMYYFYLTNYYGDVPLVLTTNYKTNAILSRSPQNLIYQQIIADLKNASNLLSTSYFDATLLQTSAERVRPTKWAAQALLSKVYLYANDWNLAENEADSVINNSASFSLSTLPNAFLRAGLGNNEAIWQLQPVNSSPQTNTQDAYFYIMPSSGPSSIHLVQLSSSLVNSFATGDGRRINWIDSIIVSGVTYYYPYKYKINSSTAPVSEYRMMLRLGELYLIRADARNAQGNSAGALSDINAIRTRAGLANYSGPTDQASLSAAIMRERRSELFCELGNRWLDLKRTGEVDSVMNIACPLKGSSWNSYQQLYPLPLTDLQADLKLVQNAGYN